jgi:hypothetical protein
MRRIPFCVLWLSPPDAFPSGRFRPQLFWSHLPAARAPPQVSQPRAFKAYLCHDRIFAWGESGGSCDRIVDIA